ncbi:hypothetical protein LIPSTDRAFT_69036 [Lipomyces starkeyi NRRL Y-11557]|uniref:Uncharacterized protein n=1 Tax=Lipomyces starkeyi NRRL Y-11557 TaxID=675824 RepID=A0A1E3QB26_LIPST|nr:hypothetical protein LIPSTDRAFT_69036 [Lipomyces starkeyi NRRL Y-11557]
MRSTLLLRNIALSPRHAVSAPLKSLPSGIIFQFRRPLIFSDPAHSETVRYAKILTSWIVGVGGFAFWPFAVKGIAISRANTF